MDLGSLLKSAAILAGQIAPGDTFWPEEAAYAFEKANDLLDEFATERLQIFREQRVGPFAVVAGQGDATVPSPITIGPGAVWNTPRPEYIDRFGVIYTAGSTPQPELHGHVFTTKEWAGVTVKGVTSTLSRAMFYDRTFDANGYGNVYLYPVPSASFQVVLYVPVAIGQFPNDVNGNPDFTTVISLPPGYRTMLLSNLAVMLSIGVLPVSADLQKRADDSRAKVMAANVVTHMDALVCDGATRNPGGQNSQGWDWIGGGFE